MYQVPEYIFTTPTTITVSGITGSGKTTWLKNLLRNPSLFSMPPKRIIYCYGTWQNAFSDMRNVEFLQGLDIPNDTNGEHTVIVLDDLMSDVVKSETAEQLFIRGSHHNDITVIFVVQNIFQQGKYARTIMLNSNYTVLIFFKSFIYPGNDIGTRQFSLSIQLLHRNML